MEASTLHHEFYLKKIKKKRNTMAGYTQRVFVLASKNVFKFFKNLF
jgi:hypothetical protein